MGLTQEAMRAIVERATKKAAVKVRTRRDRAATEAPRLLLRLGIPALVYIDERCIPFRGIIMHVVADCCLVDYLAQIWMF